MINNEAIMTLAISGAGIGFMHTLLGPDHYIPFMMMAKAQAWSKTKTLWITFFCGLGHVLSSVLLGSIGYGFGVAVFHLESIESVRGDIAAWLLLAFGLTYMVWGVHRLIRGRTHSHLHIHANGEIHHHIHDHQQEHSHIHFNNKEQTMTPWVLFTIFIFGPCEPLIPLLMYPAAQESVMGMFVVAAVFSITTVATMMATVLAGLYGIRMLPVFSTEKYMHIIAGGTLALCACAILFLGL